MPGRWPSISGGDAEVGLWPPDKPNVPIKLPRAFLARGFCCLSIMLLEPIQKLPAHRLDRSLSVLLRYCARRRVQAQPPQAALSAWKKTLNPNGSLRVPSGTSATPKTPSILRSRHARRAPRFFALQGEKIPANSVYLEFLNRLLGSVQIVRNFQVPLLRCKHPGRSSFCFFFFFRKKKKKWRLGQRPRFA